MIKNNFVAKFFITSIFTLSLVVGVIYLYVWNNDSKLQGKLVFSDTYNIATSIDRIEFKSSEETVVLTLNDTYWLIENKNNYYADFLLVNNLLNSLNKSVYSVKFPYNEKIANEKLLKNPDNIEKNSGLLIKTYSKDKLINEIIVGLPDDSKNYYFSRNLKDDNIWLISEKFDFPIYSSDWIVRPILSVSEKQIETIQIDDKQVNRFDEFTPFYNEKNEVANTRVFTDTLLRLFVVDAIPEQEFIKNITNDIKTKKITITTYMGLVFELDLYYSTNNKVWCKIKLSQTSLPIFMVNDYINDNQFLYEGWYFEISPEQGHILRDFRL